MAAYLVTRDDLLKRIAENFEQHRSGYVATKRAYNLRCGALQKQIKARQDQGSSMACSLQQLSEAVWQVHYTDDWQRVDEQLARVEAGIDSPDQDHALQQAADGSWGACLVTWYRKLEPTVDTLQLSTIDPAKLKKLTFLDFFGNAAKVMAYLWGLQISDISKTGINQRDELSAVQTALAQLLFKDQLHDLLTQYDLGFCFPGGFETAFASYLAQTQDHETGYWGPWYRLDGELVRAHDLSFTFHIVNYRRGKIDNWPLVIDTTLAIKDMLYPNGWKPDDSTPYDLHNSYDVVQIFSYGWPEMSWDQKRKVRDKILAMLDWCLTHTIASGVFTDNTLETYYYGVRFFDTLGYWRRDKRFWRTGEPPGMPSPYDLCRSLQAAFARIKDKSEEAEEVEWILAIAVSETARNAPSAIAGSAKQKGRQ